MSLQYTSAVNDFVQTDNLHKIVELYFSNLHKIVELYFSASNKHVYLWSTPGSSFAAL